MLDVIDRPKMYYPLSFGIFLHQYTSSTGVIGRHLSTSVKGTDNLIYQLPVSIQNILDKHIKTIEHYAKFHGKKFGAAANGYHTYWAPHVLSRTHRIMDKVINKLWNFSYRKNL